MADDNKQDVAAIGDLRARLRILSRFAHTLEEQVDELGYHVAREFPDHVPTIRSIRHSIKLAKQEINDFGDRLGDQLDKVSRA